MAGPTLLLLPSPYLCCSAWWCHQPKASLGTGVCVLGLGLGIWVHALASSNRLELCILKKVVTWMCNCSQHVLISTTWHSLKLAYNMYAHSQWPGLFVDSKHGWVFVTQNGPGVILSVTNNKVFIGIVATEAPLLEVASWNSVHTDCTNWGSLMLLETLESLIESSNNTKWSNLSGNMTFLIYNRRPASILFCSVNLLIQFILVTEA